MQVRRVVTAKTAAGKSVFVSDEQLDPITVRALPGGEFHRIWGSDGQVSLPADGNPPSAARYFPPASGFRFEVVTIGPDRVTMPADLDVQAAVAELQTKLPGMVEAMELDNPGMHTTDSVDFGVVLSGEVWLELDAGEQVHLRAGDCVVQNGTRHAWRNKTQAPCVMAFTLVGAKKDT